MMCKHKHMHLCSEDLLHLLRLLGIKATIKPLTSVAISMAGKRGYYFNGSLRCPPPRHRRSYAV